MSKLLVIIPAFNEGKRIVSVISGVRAAVPKAVILVINDGSHDDTAIVAAAAGAQVVSHPFNLGYGVTIQTGYKYALQHDYDYLVQIDGDGQHDPSYIPQLLEPVKKGEIDFVIGSRFLSGGSYRPPLARRIGIIFFRAVVTRVVGYRVTDCTSGYQAFNRRVMHFFAGDLFPYDYPDADVLISLHLAGFDVSEVAVQMYQNEEGKTMHNGLKPLYYVFKMLLSIFVTLARDRRFYRGADQ